MDKLGREYTAFVPVRQHYARRAGVRNPSPVSCPSAGGGWSAGRNTVNYLFITDEHY